MQKISVFLIFILSILSCTKNNSDPAWIKIEKWDLKPNNTNRDGYLSHNFSNAYVEVDDETIGFFELPIKIPVLKTGNHTIKIYPVVLNNGISASKSIYPLCQPYKIDIELNPNQTTNLTPITSYYTDCVFWTEDFEDAGIKLKTEDEYDELLSIGNNIKYLKYGNNYGQITLTKSNQIWQGKTTTNSSLPQGKNIYLEIDYLNTCTFLTGLYISNSYGIKYNPNISLNTQERSNLKWKKVYIDLRQLVSYSTPGSLFEQYFNVTNSNSNDTNFVLIDNIKLIYR